MMFWVGLTVGAWAGFCLGIVFLAGWAGAFDRSPL